MSSRGSRWGTVLARWLPALLSIGLAARFGPGLARSALWQGDLPGHLETIRWYADHVWPKPWGWDPRYLLGAPVGVLYPPLFHWTGGGLAVLVGPEWALRLLLLASIVALPPSLAFAGRGLGLRRDEAAWAAAAGLVVLWLPGPGLGGSLRQTLVAGNAANALALPLLLAFLGTARRGLLRPGRWQLPAALLASVLLTHFLMGAVAGAAVVALTLGRAWRRASKSFARGVAIAALGLLGAAPFLVPLAVHLRDASPDAIPYSPFPGPGEWLALVALVVLVLLGGRPARRALTPLVALALVFYALRALVFTTVGEPPFRMEYHRFRLILYLSVVPVAFFALRRLRGTVWRRLAWASPSAAVAILAVAAPYDARGPEPMPLPSAPTDLRARRVLVLASPAAQHGSWHGLQLALPGALGALGTKGLFVEASPFSSRIFDIERAVSAPGTHPRWWAIRTRVREPGALAPGGDLGAALRDLGVDAVVAAEPVSPRLEDVTLPARSLASGYRIFSVPTATGGRAANVQGSDRLPAEGTGVESIEGSAGLDEITVRFRDDGTSDGVARIAFSCFSDWKVESGNGSLTCLPLGNPLLGEGPGATSPSILEVRGRGSVVVSVRPRAEEWIGLGLGAIGAAAIAGGRRKRRG